MHRLPRRLLRLRTWSHDEEVPEALPGSRRALGAHGAGVEGPVRVAVGGHRIDLGQDWPHGRSSASRTECINAGRIHASLLGSSMRCRARHSASSLIALFIPSVCATTASPRSAVTCASRLCPARIAAPACPARRVCPARSDWCTPAGRRRPSGLHHHHLVATHGGRNGPVSFASCVTHRVSATDPRSPHQHWRSARFGDFNGRIWVQWAHQRSRSPDAPRAVPAGLAGGAMRQTSVPARSTDAPPSPAP